jgi:hypothetical protein
MKITLLILLGGWFVACSPAFQVQQDYDRSVNLKQFKTFRVEAERNITDDPLLGSDLNRRRITDAVTQAMEAKGYRIDESNPDLVVRYLTDVKERQQVRSNNNMSPMWWWHGPMNNNISTYNYEEGRFIVNIYQNNANKMVWQGWASGKLKAPNKREDRSEMMQNIIQDILYTFPQATGDTYSGEIGKR